VHLSVVLALLLAFASAACVEGEPSVGQASGGVRPPGAHAIVSASPSASAAMEVLAPLPPAHLASFTPPRVLAGPASAAPAARTAPASSAGAGDRRPGSPPPDPAAATSGAAAADSLSAARGPVGEDSLAP